MISQTAIIRTLFPILNAPTELDEELLYLVGNIYSSEGLEEDNVLR